MKRLAILSSIFCILSCNQKNIRNTSSNDNIEIKIETKNNILDLENSKWKLISMNGKQISSDKNASLNFEKMIDNEIRVSGVSFVNNFSSSASINGEKLKFKNGMSTTMASINNDLMELEDEFTKSIYTELDFRREKNQLILFSSNNIKLVFEEIK